MKSLAIGIALLVSTVGAVALYPNPRNPNAIDPRNHPAVQIPPEVLQTQTQPRIDVVFTLDTTGSMSGLIAAAKEKIWSIATTMAQADPAPEIRMGLVAYRDRGDAYVTRIVDLSPDLDSMYARLMEFRAGGGGDGPESVNAALDQAVNRMSWSTEPNTYRVIFLVGDAPPHMDYADEVQYPQTLQAAKARGIFVNAIQCGQDVATAQRWQQIAQLGAGSYFKVGQDGDAVAIATPFDAQLAELSAQLDQTRLYYGNATEQAAKRRKIEAAAQVQAGASVASRARRATFNASKSGEANLFGDSELVEDVASGRVALDALAPEALPEPLRGLSPEARENHVARTTEQRRELQRQIADLAGQRADYLKQKVEEAGGAGASLDDRLYGAVREQAETQGLSYKAAAPAY